MSTNVVNHAILKQYLGEVMDLGDIELAAIAGAIVPKVDEPPQLSSDRKGQKVLYARLGGIPFEFSRRADSIVVHSMEHGEPMIRGQFSKDTSVSQIGRILEHHLLMRQNCGNPRPTYGAQQSLAADGAIACFSSNTFFFRSDADRAPQLKASVGRLRVI